MTKGTYICTSPEPKMIYDFIGFPDELYEIAYPCKGEPNIANQIAQKHPDKIIADSGYGQDHGSWTLLKHIFPDASIPVFEMSIDLNLPLMQHFDLGKKLAYLRSEGIMIIGSGNMVHNLRDINWEGPDADPFHWAAKADEILKTQLISKNYKKLIDFSTLGSEVEHGIPTPDHYIPMICVLGMQQESENMQFTHESIQYGSISMRSFMIS